MEMLIHLIKFNIFAKVWSLVILLNLLSFSDTIIDVMQEFDPRVQDTLSLTCLITVIAITYLFIVQTLTHIYREPAGDHYHSLLCLAFITF